MDYRDPCQVDEPRHTDTGEPPPRSRRLPDSKLEPPPYIFAVATPECADLFCTRLRDGGYSIDEGLLERYHGDKKLSEHILDERRILREYEKGSFLDNKFRLIPKKQMRQILGHSPDIS